MSQGKYQSGGRPKKRERKVEKGIVSSVPSGDRIVVYVVENQSNQSKWAPPKKKEIKLSGIAAPAPSRKSDKDGNKIKAEPFYWESRNYLREYVIGKVVEYEIFKSKAETPQAAAAQKAKPNAIPREYGTVTVQGDDITLSSRIVSAGWARVQTPKDKEKDIPKSIADLLDLQNGAQKESRGLHSKNKPIGDALTEFDQFAKYKEWKEKKVSAVVEAVVTGSLIRVTVLPSLHTFLVRIAGVRAPNFKKDGKSEAFGQEAQFTTERYVLNRTVEIQLNGFDPLEKEKDKDLDNDNQGSNTGTFHGEILLNGKSIGELLLQSGLASVVDWSVPNGKKEAYKALERQAQEKRLRMWHAPAPVASTTTSTTSTSSSQSSAPRTNKSGTTWTGRVKGVVNGSTLAIENLDVTPARLENITLSSISVPKLGRDDQPSEPLSFEAREFVRKKLIGKTVKVSCDYVIPEKEIVDKNKKGGKQGGKQGGKNTDKDGDDSSKGKPTRKKIPEKAFFTVEHDKRNIALALVENGLATVVQGGNDRSPHYNAMVLAQDRAKQKKVGLHDKDASTKHQVNDVSRDPKKAKAVYGSLSNKRIEAVVEYVISGSRLKLYIPKDNLMVSLSLEGVRTPPIPNAKTSKKDEAPPPFALEARDFTRDLVQHHDVEVEIDGQDKSGSFKGYVWLRKKNLGVLLLQEGLALVTRSKKYEDDFEDAADTAKEQRKNLWKDYDPAKEEELRHKAESERESSSAGGPIKVILQATEVIDGGTFYAQIVGEDKSKFDELMQRIARLDLISQPPYRPTRDETVLAQFSGDQVWYRARVLSANDDNVRVFYGDFGNVESTTVANIRAPPPDLFTNAPHFQARECKLAYIVPRSLDQDWGEKAALVLKKLVWDKSLMACIEFNDQGVMYVTLWDDAQVFINGELVKKGLARAEKRPPRSAKRELIKFIRDQEDIAHDKHKGLWEDGDPGLSDEEL